MGVRKDGITLVDDVGGGGAIPVDATIVSPIGQEVMADSVSVVIASDQSPVPVDIVSPLGQEDSVNSIPVVLASDQPAIPVTIAAPVVVSATDLDIRDLAFATDKVDASGSVVDTELPAAALLADNTANPTVPGVGAFGMVWNGATWDRMPGTSLNGLLVNSPPIANTNAIGIIDALSEFVFIIPPNGYNSITIIVAGTFSGTLSFSDTSANPVKVFNLNTGKWVTELINNSGTIFLSIPVLGSTPFAIHCTAYTSGSVGIDLTASLSCPTYHPLTAVELRESPLDTSEVKSGVATQTQVADNAASVTILAANANRLGASITNTSTVTLFLRLSSSAATTSNYTVPLVAGAYYEVPFGYTGAITGIWASDPGTGNANVSEFTA